MIVANMIFQASSVRKMPLAEIAMKTKSFVNWLLVSFQMIKALECFPTCGTFFFVFQPNMHDFDVVPIITLISKCRWALITWNSTIDVFQANVHNFDMLTKRILWLKCLWALITWNSTIDVLNFLLWYYFHIWNWFRIGEGFQRWLQSSVPFFGFFVPLPGNMYVIDMFFQRIICLKCHWAMITWNSFIELFNQFHHFYDMMIDFVSQVFIFTFNFSHVFIQLPNLYRSFVTFQLFVNSVVH